MKAHWKKILNKFLKTKSLLFSNLQAYIWQLVRLVADHVRDKKKFLALI